MRCRSPQISASLELDTVLQRVCVAARELTDRVGDFLCPRGDLTLILSLNHDAKQRFGSGITNQETPVSGQPRFDSRDDAG